MESVRTKVRAAVLACRDDAPATHHASIALYGIRSPPEGPIDVTTIGRHVAPRGVRPHTVRALEPADRRMLRGIPVTAPARALLEVAAQLTPRELADAVEQAQINASSLRPRSPPRSSDRRAGAGWSRCARSPRTRRSRDLAPSASSWCSCAAARLPEPVFNVKVEGWEVDAFWERERAA